MLNKKFDFMVDQENRTISFAGKEWKSFFYIKKVGDVPSIYGIYGGGKKAYQEFNNTYGILPSNFKKVFNALMKKVWISPIEKHVKRYAFTYAGKVASHVVEKIWENKTLIDQYEKDGNNHLVPFAVFYGKDTKTLKESFGKATWKRVCNQSMTRNSYIAQTCRLYVSVSNFVDLPSYVLKRGRNSGIEFDTYGKWVVESKVYSKTNTYENRRWYNTCRDTRSMAVQLGKHFDFSWSKEKMLEKHEEFTRLINEKKYSKEPFVHLKDFKVKKLDYKGYEAILCDNAMDIHVEGKEMHHCVGSYASSVSNNTYLVFSVRKEGKRSSTIGINVRDGKYVFSQHYGHCNSQVDCEDEKALCKMLIEKLNTEQAP